MNLPVDLGINGRIIKCVDMHTTGEPTRIIYSGYPDLKGTLLQQRALATEQHDHIRKSLILEPRGHREMYGAILRHETELTASGEAHLGVLFTTNEGYSTMCGHATIALGRFLVDVHDLEIFPKRNELEFDSITKSYMINLHAPCGLIKITVPTNDDGSRANSSCPVSFFCVPSFAVGIDLQVPIPDAHSWPELRSKKSVKVDLSYGGAFYCLITASELGFPQGLKVASDLQRLDTAAKLLKETINRNPELKGLIRHPEHDDLSFLYSVIIVDDTVGVADVHTSGVETGLCFFGDQQIDRSPTGSAVAARVALAYAKGKRRLGERWTYHSMISNFVRGGSFCGQMIEEIRIPSKFGPDVSAAVVKVEGFAYYTAFNTFIIEDGDPIQEGFLLDRLT